MAAGSPSWPHARNTVAATLCWWRTSWAADRPRSTSLLWVSLGTGWPGGQRTGKAEAPSRMVGLRASPPQDLLLRHPAHSFPCSHVPCSCSHTLAVLHTPGEAQTHTHTLQHFPVATNLLLASPSLAFANLEPLCSRPTSSTLAPSPPVHCLFAPQLLSLLADPQPQSLLPSTALLLHLIWGHFGKITTHRLSAGLGWGPGGGVSRLSVLPHSL